MIHISEHVIRVQLKYCERCGGLFFRRDQSDERLCTPCTLRPADSLFRHCERPLPEPARKPSQRVTAAWYGPMSATVERLQGAVELGSSCGLATCDLRPGTAACIAGGVA